jgi:hypothetical protein
MSSSFALVNFDKKLFYFPRNQSEIPTINSVYASQLMTLLQTEWNGNRIVCACDKQNIKHNFCD